ncbi:MAG TPA: hypothetical protein VEE83_01335 [Thermoplasmata archaeon]|nr:hypothetical protein [Thermoplasmata archaeon]
MELHRVRRLAGTLVASQLRTGRSSSDPRSFLGRPILIGTVDAALFVGALVLVFVAIRESPASSSVLGSLAETFLPFVPIVAVGVVLVAGIMFELTTTSKFAGSDAANWLPITPAEYLLSSVSAVAYTYSPTVALALGVFFPVALLGGQFPLFLAASVFAVAALFEGAALVEMVRSVTQRTSEVTAGRRGQVNLIVRAVVLVLVILVLQLAFNPVFILGAAQQLSIVGLVTALVPFFWSTQALTQWVWGDQAAGTAFAVGEFLFLGALLYVAQDLRERFWAPAPVEVQLTSHEYARRNRLLALFRFSDAESALVSKDLKGLFRRREMLPTLVVPIVLAVLVLVEGPALGQLSRFISAIWIGWVAGFFALLVSSSSMGQERKAVQSLYAFPLLSRSIVRAKAAFVLVPSMTVAVVLALLVGFAFGMNPAEVGGMLLLVLAAAVVLTFWGLAFASRYSDFQERPRPQFLRPGPMILATASGMVLLFAIIVPGTMAMLLPSSFSLLLGTVSLLLAVGAGALALHWTSTGFRQLMHELPF